jgi:hypothetical protein
VLKTRLAFDYVIISQQNKVWVKKAI